MLSGRAPAGKDPWGLRRHTCWSPSWHTARLPSATAAAGDTGKRPEVIHVIERVAGAAVLDAAAPRARASATA